ncbi:MAG: hypothetical protein ACRER5_02880 [Pseudomonas sp.]
MASKNPAHRKLLINALVAVVPISILVAVMYRDVRAIARTNSAMELIDSLAAPNTGSAKHQMQIDGFHRKVVACLDRGQIYKRIRALEDGDFDQAVINQLVEQARATCAGDVLREVALSQPAAAAALGRLAHQHGMPVPPGYLDESADLSALGEL